MSTTISQSLLPEFDHEMANTRRILERVPEDRIAWTPHEKSMSMGRLAAHIAETPVWATVGLTLDEFDLTPASESGQMTTRAKLLDTFDANVADARMHMAAADDDTMLKPWTFKKNGQTVMTMPKVVVVRSFVLSHLIHHRGQLSVYLRLNEVPVPGLYGPSADEQ